ncbi:MAG: hypothetical protein V4677_16290 [Bacteroidota bacterium]
MNNKPSPKRKTPSKKEKPDPEKIDQPKIEEPGKNRIKKIDDPPKSKTDSSK